MVELLTARLPSTRGEVNVFVVTVIIVFAAPLSSENNIRHILRDQWFVNVLNEVRPY